MVLLIGAVLRMRSFYRLTQVHPGFNSDRVLTMSIALPPVRYSENFQMVRFFYDLAERVRALPGVRAAAVASALPVNISRMSPALMEGQPLLPLPERPVIVIRMIGPSYFETLDAPMVRGRAFDRHDDASARPVVIVNQTLARMCWPNDHVPYFSRGCGCGGGYQKQRSDFRFSARGLFALRAAFLAHYEHLIVRAARDPMAMVTAVRHEVAALDPDQPITEIQTMDHVLASVARIR